MGRTVCTWRMRAERRIEKWSGFRRALRPSDRRSFDRLILAVRGRAAAGGMIPAADAFEPILLAMLVDLSSRIDLLEKELEVRKNQLEN